MHDVPVTWASVKRGLSCMHTIPNIPLFQSILWQHISVFVSIFVKVVGNIFFSAFLFYNFFPILTIIAKIKHCHKLDRLLHLSTFFEPTHTLLYLDGQANA